MPVSPWQVIPPACHTCVCKVLRPSSHSAESSRALLHTSEKNCVSAFGTDLLCMIKALANATSLLSVQTLLKVCWTVPIRQQCIFGKRYHNQPSACGMPAALSPQHTVVRSAHIRNPKCSAANIQSNLRLRLFRCWHSTYAYKQLFATKLLDAFAIRM